MLQKFEGKVPLTKNSTLKEFLNYLAPGTMAITFNREQWLQFKKFFDSLPEQESGVSVA